MAKWKFEESSPPPHPGEILWQKFLAPRNLSQTGLAKKLGVNFRTIHDIVNCKRGISPEMAIKLSRFFGTTPQYWMDLQRDYDLWRAYKKMKMRGEL